MTRRRFVLLAAAAAVLCAAGLRRLAGRASRPANASNAAAGVFPGRLRPYDEAEARQQGRWAG